VDDSVKETPPKFRPNFRYRGLNPIRSGQRFNLGYEVSGPGQGRYYVAPRGVGGARRASWYPLDEAGWDSAWSAFEEAEPGAAADYRRRLDPSFRQGDAEAAAEEPLSATEAAARRLTALLVGGGLVSLAGVALFFGCWLARSSALAHGTEAGGFAPYIVLGALVTLVGNALLLVGLIGWGVKLGREAADV
jgi:hypothetical protein